MRRIEIDCPGERLFRAVHLVKGQECPALFGREPGRSAELGFDGHVFLAVGQDILVQGHLLFDMDSLQDELRVLRVFGNRLAQRAADDLKLLIADAGRAYGIDEPAQAKGSWQVGWIGRDCRLEERGGIGPVARHFDAQTETRVVEGRPCALGPLLHLHQERLLQVALQLRDAGASGIDQAGTVLFSESTIQGQTFAIGTMLVV